MKFCMVVLKREIILGGKHGLELSQGESGTVRTPLRVSLSLNPKEEPVLRSCVPRPQRHYGTFLSFWSGCVRYVS